MRIVLQKQWTMCKKNDVIKDNIDQNLPENLKGQKMPENRKKLIAKLLSLRFERLKDLLNEVVR
jgi:hypothetical protein